MSASYHLIMNRDFTGMVDDYSVKNYDMITPDQKNEQEVCLITLPKINMTRDKMDEDDNKKVCLTNWAQVGCILMNSYAHKLKSLDRIDLYMSASRNALITYVTARGVMDQDLMENFKFLMLT